MRFQSSFDAESHATWTEQERPPLDLSKFQKVMFLDRPDLWPQKRKNGRRGRKPLEGQQSLFSISGERRSE